VKNKHNNETEFLKTVSDVKENCIEYQNATNVNNRIVDKIRKNTASRDYYAKSEIDKCFK